MLESLIDHLRQVESFEELDRFVHTFRDALGIEHLVYHSVNSTGEQYASLTYSDDWVQHYVSSDYNRVDPVVQACYRRFHPIDWKQLDWSGKAARGFLGEALDAGVGHQGFSVPIRGPSGQFALFSVSDRANDEAWAKFTSERVPDLLLVSHYVNQKALELERGTDQVPMASLSPRETDALTLLALGKSRAQAAESLSISEHTLRVYIESARFKLAAMNTTHAVARAMAYGLLVV